MNFGERYVVTKSIGMGSFGKIFEVIDSSTNKGYAMKVQSSQHRCPQLKHEFEVYKKLSGRGFPKVYEYLSDVELPKWMFHHSVDVTCEETEKGCVMIMEKLGRSLETVYNLCNRQFSNRTVAMIGIQLVNRLERLHSLSYLHRDVKPDNFLIGDISSCKTEREAALRVNVLYMIDMGLAHRWENEDSVHIEYRDGQRLTGTPRYASVRTHQGVEQTRRDDIESLGYVLLYLAISRLPWQGIRGETKEAMYRKIGEKKHTIPISELVGNAPAQLGEFIQSARNLKFDEKPDYKAFRKLLRAMCNPDFEIDWNFDWMVKNVLWKSSGKIRKQNEKADGKSSICKKRPQQVGAEPCPKRQKCVPSPAKDSSEQRKDIFEPRHSEKSAEQVIKQTEAYPSIKLSALRGGRRRHRRSRRRRVSAPDLTCPVVIDLVSMHKDEFDPLGHDPTNRVPKNLSPTSNTGCDPELDASGEKACTSSDSTEDNVKLVQICQSRKTKMPRLERISSEDDLNAENKRIKKEYDRLKTERDCALKKCATQKAQFESENQSLKARLQHFMDLSKKLVHQREMWKRHEEQYYKKLQQANKRIRMLESRKA